MPLSKVAQELASTRELVDSFKQKITSVKASLDQEGLNLNGINQEITV